MQAYVYVGSSVRQPL